MSPRQRRWVIPSFLTLLLLIVLIASAVNALSHS